MVGSEDLDLEFQRRFVLCRGWGSSANRSRFWSSEGEIQWRRAEEGAEACVGERDLFRLSLTFDELPSVAVSVLSDEFHLKVSPIFSSDISPSFSPSSARKCVTLILKINFIKGWGEIIYLFILIIVVLVDKTEIGDLLLQEIVYGFWFLVFGNEMASTDGDGTNIIAILLPDD